MSARRSTLASIDAPNNNSGIPAPSSALKASRYMSSQSGAGAAPSSSHRASRQSLAPQRQSVAPGGNDDFGSSRVSSTPAGSRLSSRQSVMMGGSMGVGPGSIGRASTAGGVGATPNTRRSMNGRQSLAPGAFPMPSSSNRPPANVDPRPLRSREYLAEMKHRVHNFAEQTGFAVAGYRGMTSLDSPTQAVFLGLFRHIFHHAIDNHYTFQTDAKKPEEEIMAILQEYKYPAMGDVTKMLLGSASSSQYWPKTLGILDWMVTLSQSAQHVPPGPLGRDQRYSEDHSALVRNLAHATAALNSAPKNIDPAQRQALQLQVDQAKAQLEEAEERHDEERENKLFHPFVWRCYQRFWDGEDYFPDEIDRLADFFNRKGAAVRHEVEGLRAEKRALEMELKELETEESPLAKATEARNIVRTDIRKFKMYRDDILLPKLEKGRTTVERLQETKRELLDKLRHLRAEQETLNAQVAAQEMSGEEFDRLTAERSNLMVDKDRLEEEIQGQENHRYDLELSNANMQQKLEEKLKVFNPLGTKVGIFPIKVRKSTGPGEEMLDEIDLQLGQSSLIHPGLDLKNDLRATISQLRRRTEMEQRKAIEERVEKQERLDEISDRLHAVKQEETQVKAQLEVVREHIDDITARTDEETRAFNEDQLLKGRKLQHAQQSGHRQLAEADGRLIELRAHSKHVKTLVVESLEKYKEELCAAAEECIALKTRVSESIEEIGAKAGVEIKRRDDEFGGQDQGQDVSEEYYDESAVKDESMEA